MLVAGAETRSRACDKYGVCVCVHDSLEMEMLREHMLCGAVRCGYTISRVARVRLTGASFAV